MLIVIEIEGCLDLCKIDVENPNKIFDIMAYMVVLWIQVQ